MSLIQVDEDILRKLFEIRNWILSVTMALWPFMCWCAVKNLHTHSLLWQALTYNHLRLVLHCVSKKRHPFYFCKNLAKYYPISIIFDSSIPEEICKKSVHVYPPHLFTVLIPYLVKLYDPLTCVYIVLKSGPFTVCNKFARCHPNLIIFSRHCVRRIL